jgi:glucose dehydrogenase
MLRGEPTWDAIPGGLVGGPVLMSITERSRHRTPHASSGPQWMARTVRGTQMTRSMRRSSNGGSFAVITHGLPSISTFGRERRWRRVWVG